MRDLRVAIARIRWPPRSRSFTIFPQSGKKRGEGNGVKPIKDAFVASLVKAGWTPEHAYPKEEGADSPITPGAFDACLAFKGGRPPFVAEWETGNISSSHRALNKMALAMMAGKISGGVLILPTRALYKFLTDRVGNIREIEPYFTLWKSLRVENDYLAVIAVEHDRTSEKVPRIRKGTDGRALI